jgi:hypothetical protein
MASTPKRKQTVRARKAADGGQAELARLRRILLAIPGAIEKLSHGEPTWFAGEKGRVFAMFDNHHHGAEHISVYFPTPPGLQQTLTASEPGRYWVPPYVGHKGWVAVILDGKPDWDRVEWLARHAFEDASRPARRRR